MSVSNTTKRIKEIRPRLDIRLPIGDIRSSNSIFGTTQISFSKTQIDHSHETSHEPFPASQKGHEFSKISSSRKTNPIAPDTIGSR